METKFILLWLEAPLQSWGYDSKFNRRDTLDFPTKSGILGLLFCSMGATGEQSDLLADFADLRQTVISYQYCKLGKLLPKQPLLHDFHMIGSGYDENDIWQSLLVPKTAEGKSPVGGGTKLTHRYYLQDAIFSVILEIPACHAEEIVQSLENPAYPIYFGRKCCVPSDFVYRGIFETEEDACHAASIIAEAKGKDRNTSDNTEAWSLKEVFKVVDGVEEGDSFTLNDVPVQFGTNKKYKDRRVTKIQLL